MTHATQARIAALVAAGFLAATTAGISYADTTTSGNGSIGGGNQLNADLDVPLNVCGNAIAILGLAGAQCTDGKAAVVDKSSTDRGPHSEDDGYGEEPGGENPGGEKPDEEEPGHENPGGEEPGGEEPGGENPGGEEPGGEKPGEENPGEEQPPAPTPGPSEGPDRDDLAEEGAEPADDLPRPGASGYTPGESPVTPDSDTQLAVTGEDASGLFGLVAASVAAIALGAGLVVAGLRRRARA